MLRVAFQSKLIKVHSQEQYGFSFHEEKKDKAIKASNEEGCELRGDEHRYILSHSSIFECFLAKLLDSP